MPHTTLPQGFARSHHEMGRRTQDTPPNHNTAWLETEEHRALLMFRNGMAIHQIATELGRTPGAINGRLSRMLGIAFPDTPNRYRSRGEPLVHRSERRHMPFRPRGDIQPAQIQPRVPSGPQVTFAWPSPYTTDGPIAGSQEMVSEPGTPNPGWRLHVTDVPFEGSIQETQIAPPTRQPLLVPPPVEWDTWLAAPPPDVVPTPPPDAIYQPEPGWQSAWQPIGPETRAREAEMLRSLMHPIAPIRRRARVEPWPRPAQQPAPLEVPPHLEPELPMTKKHFVALATEIQSLRPPTQEGRAAATQHSTLNKLAYRLASLFEGENSSFDRDRWLQACGVATTERT